MRFILLIYAKEADWAAKSAEEKADVMRRHHALDAELKAAGKLGACDALQSTKTATSVRVRDGKSLVTDGPFAETKEQLAGFYVVDAKNLDDAIAISTKLPPAAWGTIEIRPIHA